MKKNVILKKDYERYTVNLPWKTIIGRRKRRFLFSELEKLHPCFSSECSFDSKLKLGRKGFKSDLVVMSGLRLAEYKARYPGKRLFIEENLKKSVFSGRKWSWKIILPGLSLLVCLSGMLSFGGKKAASVSHGACDVAAERAAEEGQSFSELVTEFLGVMQEKKGSLYELSLKSQGGVQKISAFADGLFPEDFESLRQKNYSLSFSPVTYRENRSFFNLNAEVRGNKVNEEILWSNGNTLDSEQVARLQNYRPEIRKIITESKAVLLEEMTSPWGIRFCIKDMDLLDCESLVQKIADFTFENKVGISSMSIKKVSEEALEVGIKGNEAGYFEGLDIGVLKNNLNLFAIKKKPEVVSIPVITRGEDLPLGNGKKLGEIVHQNGRKTVFYRNQEGKIERKEGM